MGTGSQGTSEESERAELEGFASGDPAGSRRFLYALQTAVRSEVRRRWPSLRHVADDVEAEALETVVRWRAEKRLRPGESLAELVGRLVKQCANGAKKRAMRDERLASAEASLPAAGPESAEELLAREEGRAGLWGLVGRLAPRDQAVLRAKAQEPPPMAEAHGVAPDHARQLFRRAKLALLALAEASAAQDDLRGLANG